LLDKVKYWIEIAEYDLDTAKAMLETKRYLYVGFMCHMVIEKALKAIISNSEIETMPPKIHNLIRLANIANIFDKLSEQQHKFLVALNPLNVEARYPQEKEEIYATLSNDDCAKLLTGTEELFLWIKQQL